LIHKFGAREDGEEIEAPDAALSLIARGWKEGGLRSNAFMLALALAVPIAAALLLARSRGGAISALIAILAMALLVAISPKARIARAAFACCAAALILAGLGWSAPV
jgi:hypothetical protein